MNSRALDGRHEVLFFPRFLALVALLPLVYVLPSTVTGFLRSATIDVVIAAARSLGMNAVYHDKYSVFFGDQFFYIIDLDCTAVTLFYVYVAAILAYPATWRYRWRGILVGFAAMYALNLVRLVVLGWIGEHHFEYYSLFHVYGFQVFFLLVLGIGWSRWALSSGRPMTISAASTLVKALRVGSSFVLAFTALAAAGHALTMDRLYVGVVSSPARVLVAALGGTTRVWHLDKSSELGLCAAVTAATTLFLVDPVGRLRDRIRAAITRGWPVVVVSHVVAVLGFVAYQLVRQGVPGKSVSISLDHVELAPTALLALTYRRSWVGRFDQRDDVGETAHASRREPNRDG